MMFVPKLGTEQLEMSLEAGSSLLAILGVTNFIARFLVGFISQKNVASPVTLQFLGRIISVPKRQNPVRLIFGKNELGAFLESLRPPLSIAFPNMAIANL